MELTSEDREIITACLAAYRLAGRDMLAISLRSARHGKWTGYTATIMLEAVPYKDPKRGILRWVDVGIINIPYRDRTRRHLAIADGKAWAKAKGIPFADSLSGAVTASQASMLLNHLTTGEPK